MYEVTKVMVRGRRRYDKEDEATVLCFLIVTPEEWSSSWTALFSHPLLCVTRSYIDRIAQTPATDGRDLVFLPPPRLLCVLVPLCS
jgi:hypothetical protein